MTRSLPLAGVRVLDLTRLLPGPLAAQHLAHLGATVIKIEDRAEGDYARAMGAAPDKTSQFFLSLNRNKSFVALDLKDPKEHAELLRLIARCDVLIEGFRPGVMARLGLGQERLLEINPALVTCSITGYGQDGPLAHAAGHDINYLSFTGVLQQNAGSDGKPAVLGLQVADLLGGTQAAVIGVLAALYDAKRGAKGRHVDISMTDVVFGHNLVAAAHFNETGTADVPGHELLTGGEACYNVYTCADGRHMAVGSLEAKFWDRLCSALGREDLMPCHWSRGQTPGSASARAAIEAVAAAFLARDQAAWTALLGPLDCCVTPILSVAEALAHPLFAARKMVETIASDQGVSTLPAFPIRFVGEGAPVSSAAKARGADQALLSD